MLYSLGFAMRVIKDTPLEIGFRVYQLRPPRPSLTVAVKGSFDLVPDGAAVFSKEPTPVGGGTFFDDDPDRSLRHPSDLALLKPRGECFLVGKAYTPNKRPMRALQCSFRVGTIKKDFAVFGDRHWKSGSLTFGATEPARFTEMPLCFERSFGGPEHEINPYGRGMEPDPADREGRIALPNLEQPRDLVDSPNARPVPMATFPFHPASALRMRYVGTYGPAYMARRWPFLPEDFRWEHFLEAPPDQHLPAGKFFRGDEKLSLKGLHPAYPELSSRLPGLRARVFLDVRMADGRPGFVEVPMKLDTVTLDTELARVFVVWRGLLEVRSETLEDVAHLFVDHEPLAAQPASRDAMYAKMREQIAREEAEEEEAEGEDPPGDEEADAGVVRVYPPEEFEAPDDPGADDFGEEEEQAYTAFFAKGALLSGADLAAAQRAVYGDKGPPSAPPSDWGADDFADDFGEEEEAQNSTLFFEAPSEIQGGSAEKKLVSFGDEEDEADGASTHFFKPNELAAAIEAEKARLMGQAPPSGLPTSAPVVGFEEDGTTIGLGSDLDYSVPNLPTQAPPVGFEEEGTTIGLEGSGAPLPTSAPVVGFEEDGTTTSQGAAAAAAEGAAVAEEPEEPEPEELSPEERALEAQMKALDEQLAAMGIPTLGAEEGPPREAAPVDPEALLKALAASGIEIPDSLRELAAELKEPPPEEEAEEEEEPEEEAEEEEEPTGRALVIALMQAGQPLCDLDLSEADLSGLNLFNQDLSGSILRKAKLREANLTRVNCTGANLSEADLTGAQAVAAVFDEADLSEVRAEGVSFDESSFQGADLDAAKLAGASFAGARAEAASFVSADLRGASFAKASLSEADLDLALLDDANFTEAVATASSFEEASALRARFDGADLSGSDFELLKAEDARFRSATLKECMFEKARLVRADFTLADLSEGDFSDALLAQASLDGCLLRGCAFDRADLRGARARRADLLDASLESADLSYADFSFANLFAAELWRAKTEGLNTDQANIERTHLQRR